MLLLGVKYEGACQIRQSAYVVEAGRAICHTRVMLGRSHIILVCVYLCIVCRKKLEYWVQFRSEARLRRLSNGSCHFMATGEHLGCWKWAEQHKYHPIIYQR